MADAYLDLLPYANSDVQREALQKLSDSRTIHEAAQSLGIHERSLRRTLARVRRNAARQGYSPEHGMTKRAPSPFVVSGVSTLYGSDGEISAQWVKTKLEETSLSQLQDAIDESMSQYKGAYKPKAAPKNFEKDTLCVIPMGDPHIGMYAWKEETGEDFDLTIAREDLLQAFQRLLDSTPKTERILIVNLGDFFHADNVSNLTSRSGHSLDVDTRWAKVLQLGCMLMVDLVQMALEKHKKIEVINAIGNHDDHSSVMLASFLGAYFHKEKRVFIHPTVNKFHYVDFGKCLIGVTHGDTTKMQNLGELMASDQPELWGQTEHRYWYTGHIHHTSKTELRGCVVESFRTLAAKDAWHTSQGYRSGRDMYSIVLHKDFGEVERYRCDIRRARSK